MREPEAPTRTAIEAIWRIEAARLIGGLVRLVRDVDRAEDLAQEALLTALERWPEAGIPDNPGAWLMTTAKNRATDERRRRAMMDAKHGEIERTAAQSTTLDVEALDEPVGDDVLRLVLIACHPVLSEGGARRADPAPRRGALDRGDRARLSHHRGDDGAADRPRETDARPKPGCRSRSRPARSSARASRRRWRSSTSSSTRATRRPSGEDWLRPDLCEEAMRLGRILVGLVPDDAEAHGLLALMELQASRAQSARRAARGADLLLRARPRASGIACSSPAGSRRSSVPRRCERPLGPYTLQAAIAACHAVAQSRRKTPTGRRVVALYDALVELTGSPVVELNRAVAVSMAYGPAEACRSSTSWPRSRRLRDYHLLPSVRGDLLLEAGQARRGQGGAGEGRSDGDQRPRARPPPRPRRQLRRRVGTPELSVPRADAPRVSAAINGDGDRRGSRLVGSRSSRRCRPGNCR